MYQSGNLEESGTSYEIMSAGFDCGNACSIRIDGTERAVNSRGLNIVVWDNKEDRMLDSVCFDTNSGLAAAREPLEPAEYDGRLYAPLNIEEYLSALSRLDKEKNSIFIAAKGDVTSALSGSAVDGLKALGLETGLTAEKSGCSYYAAVLNGQVIENNSNENPIYNGETGSGIPFQLLSTVSAGGNLRAVLINGEECAVNADGLNFVVYDNENKRVTSSICFQPDNGKLKIVKEKKHPTALEEIQAYSYIDTLVPKEGYVYFIAAMDEASGGLTDAIKMSMHRIGLKTDLTGQYRSSYYAVITADGIEEKAGYGRLQKKGYLKDGKTAYEIMSAGFNCGNDCSVKINGEEHAVRQRGLNIVTYDESKRCVVDSVCIDTCEALQFYR